MITSHGFRTALFLLAALVSFSSSFGQTLTSAQKTEWKAALNAEKARVGQQKGEIYRRYRASEKSALVARKTQFDNAARSAGDAAQVSTLRAGYAVDVKRIKEASAEKYRAEMKQAAEDYAFNCEEINKSYGVQR